MMDEKVLDDWFSYKKPTEEQVADMTVLRDIAKDYARMINTIAPDGPDKTYAIRLLRMTVMTHNLAIMFPGVDPIPNYPGKYIQEMNQKEYPFPQAGTLMDPSNKALKEKENKDAESSKS